MSIELSGEYHEDCNRLIAEIERLQREEKNDAIAYKAAIQRQEEIRDERDQLKAENESLRQKLDLQEMLGTPEQFLAAKDAERYRSMFGRDGWDYSDSWYGLSKSDVDYLIDANRSPENP